MFKLLFGAFIAACMLSAQALPHGTGPVHTARVELSYEMFGVRGSAFPVIASMGAWAFARLHVDDDVWPGVARNRLVVFYDQRGTRRSKQLQADAPQSMDAQVADLRAVRAALKLDKFALVGDCYGGMLGMAYAATHPEHVGELILSDSATPPWKSIVQLLAETFPDIRRAECGGGEEACE